MVIVKSGRLPTIPDSTWPPTGRKESASVGGTSPNSKRQSARRKPTASVSGWSQNSTRSTSTLLTVQKLANHISGDCTATRSRALLSPQPRNTKSDSLNVAGWDVLFVIPAPPYLMLRSKSRLTWYSSSAQKQKPIKTMNSRLMDL
jgi:hypothetical protein